MGQTLPACAERGRALLGEGWTPRRQRGGIYYRTGDDDDDIEVRDIEFEGEEEDFDGQQDQYEPVMDENDRKLLPSDAVSDA